MNEASQKRNLLKKQKVSKTDSNVEPRLVKVTGVGKISLKRIHQNDIPTNEPAMQKGKWTIKSEPRRLEEKRNATCIRPTTSSRSFVTEWRESVEQLTEKLTDKLANNETEVRSLKNDLQFTIEQLERVNTQLKTERIEKEKLLQEVSELTKANNGLIAQNKISTRRVEIAHDAFMKLKSRTIAYIADSYIDEEDANLAQEAENVPV